MSAVTPKVWTDAWSSFAYLESPCDGRVTLDTPAWVAWLESAAAVSFAYPVFDPARGYMVGVMTVRKECRRSVLGSVSPTGGTTPQGVSRRVGRDHAGLSGANSVFVFTTSHITACSRRRRHKRAVQQPPLTLRVDGHDLRIPCLRSVR